MNKNIKYQKIHKIGRFLWSTTKLSLLMVSIGVAFGGGAAGGYFASLVKDEPVRSYNEIKEKVFSNYLTGFAYFNDEKLIGHLRAEEDRRLVKKDDVSSHLINAIIATEDKNFYEHVGVDVNGLSRAVVQDITGSSVQTGGSTLTQQLIKQTILTPEVSHERKAKEILLSLRIERMFSKDQILEAYMNEMYFGKSANGSNIYGVQAAAKGIFDVDVKDLNVAQSSYIAGMLQSPSRYIPFNEKGLERGLERKKIVLQRMLENGYITPQQFQEASQYDIKKNLAEPKTKAYSQYPFLMMEIEERTARILAEQELEKTGKTDIPKEQYRALLESKKLEILRGGYHIYTTIDQKVYDMMSVIAKEPNNFGPNRDYKDSTGKKVENALEEVGATLIDNQTGAILGFIGGRDFHVQQVNHTTRWRQPGSAMKPLVYATAFEEGILQPGIPIDDSPIKLSNGDGKTTHSPANWDNKFHGLISVREALRQSYNIPAIKAYLAVGIPKALGYVQQMGVTTIVTPEDNPKHNDYQAKTGVIGGLTQGLTVEEITNAYSVFPNQGSFLDAYLIEKIVNANGETVYEHQLEPKRVFSEQTAYLTTDIMRTVVNAGTASSLRKIVGKERDIAGKTGTTNEDHDSWFVGYLPEVTLGVWIGYDIPHSLPKARPPRPIQIWGKIVNGLTELYPENYPKNSKFTKPEGIVSRTICSKSGKLPSELCQSSGGLTTDIFNQKFIPTETDNSYQKAKTVQWDGKWYLAKDTTPSDMVVEKVGILTSGENQEDSEFDDPTLALRPSDWSHRLPSQIDPREDDGNAPSSPQGMKVSGSDIVWNSNPEKDVVGYRIYLVTDGEKKIASVVQSVGKKVKLPQQGIYYIKAVDVAGKESEPSDFIQYGEISPPPKEEDQLETPTDKNPSSNTPNESPTSNDSGEGIGGFNPYLP